MDGLVEIIPRKGILIPVVTQEIIRNVLEVRLPVERIIVSLAVERASDEELGAIKVMLEAGNSIDSDDREGYMRLDQEFHRKLAEATHNSVLVDVLDMVHHRSSILWFVGVSGRKDFRAVQKEHENLLNAIIKRDQTKAVRLITDHLTRFLKETEREILI
jgi:DNA-binding GntR family transcriptional regulator